MLPTCGPESVSSPVRAQRLVAVLLFLSAFDGFAYLRFGRVRNVGRVALIHVEHAERACPVRIRVLD